MKHLLLRLIAGCAILFGSCSVMAGNIPAGIVPNSDILTSSGQNDVNQSNLRLKISWSEFNPLVFSGTPGQTQTGEIAYRIHTSVKCKEIWLKVTGTAFNNGGVFLDTRYRADNGHEWYKAGTPFLTKGVPGKENKIEFQATTGPKISSQHAGVYTAKLSVSVISMK